MKFLGVTSWESRVMWYSSDSSIIMVVMSSELSSAKRKSESRSASGRASSRMVRIFSFIMVV